MKRILQTVGILVLAALALPARAQVGFSAGGLNYYGPNAVNPIIGLSIPYVNAAATGTTTNRLAKIIDVGGAPKGQLLGTGDTTLGFGICSSGCGTTGTGQIDVLGISNCDFDGATTDQDYVIASVTTAGKCHDAGSATVIPTGVAVFGRVLSTNGGAGTYTLNLNTPDVASASSGPNGKGSSVKGNGSNANNIVDLNSTTPAAAAGFVNATVQTSTSGNTTSMSVEVPAIHSFFGSFGSTAAGSSALSSGLTTYTAVPFGCTIKATTILISPADTATFTTWKVATGTALPTVGNSISTSGISISSGTAVRSTTVTDFTTTTVSANDFIGIHLNAVGGTATFASFMVECDL